MGYEIYAIGGFGSQTMYGMHVDMQTPKGNIVRCLNTYGDPAGSTVFEKYHRMFKFDIVISLWDYMLTDYLNKYDIPWIAQGPIDGPMNERWANYIRNAVRIIAYSNFARRELLKHFPPSRIEYIPHGVRTDVFKPLSEREKREMRELMGIPEDAFVFINVSDNVPRKQLGFLLYCFRKFLDMKRDEKDRIYLILWTNWTVGWPRGLEIPTIIYDLRLDNNVKLPALDPMINPIEDPDLCKIYNAADIMIHTSIAEGFGLILVEAMACGIPVIATDSSSMTELVKPTTGWLIETVKDYVYYPAYVPTGQYHFPPSISSTLERMEEAYKAWESGEIKRLKKRCREFALQYDWDKIMPLWDKTIREVWEEVCLFREIVE